MPIPFSRTLRALESDRLGDAMAGLFSTLLLLALWSAWFVKSRVAVYEVSNQASLSADDEPHPIAAAVSGRIVRLDLHLADVVRAGAVVARIDDSRQQAMLTEQRARAAALENRVSAIREQIRLSRQAVQVQARGSTVGLEQLQSQAEDAEKAALQAEREADRLVRLNASGVVSEAELQRTRLIADQRRSAADSSRSALERLRWGQRTEERDRLAAVAELESGLDELRGEAASLAATIESAKHDIDLRVIRAPVSGRIGEIGRFRLGSVISVGERLGSVVPDGRLKVIAEFDPGSALGRLRPGQRASFHLTGFPSSQYGSLAATVADVASEPRDGRIRADLIVHPNPMSRLPVQHGLLGTVEVEVEHVSPAELVLRSVGRIFEPQRDASPATGTLQ